MREIMKASLKRPVLHVLCVMLVMWPLVSPSESSAAESWWQKSAKPYKGTVLHGISENTPPSLYVHNVLTKQFEKETGIKVELELADWDTMYDKSTRDMATGKGAYDFVYIEQDIFYASLAQNFLVNLSTMLDKNPALHSPLFHFEDFTSFINYFKDPDTDEIYGVPMEGFLKAYLYRKDLFEKPEIKRAFHNQYGYPLKPAATLKAYRDNAEFFTHWSKDNGLEMWGATVQARLEHPSSFYEVVETLFPMHGIYNWGINTDNWKASVKNGGKLNSQRAKQALTYWLDLLKYAPPEAKDSDWGDVARSFAAGRVAQGWVYGDNMGWLTSDPDRSRVIGKVAVALPPLHDGVLQEAEKGKGYIGYYDGGAFGISKSSKQKEAALLWLQFIGQPSVQAEWTIKSVGVTHSATLNDPAVKAQDDITGGYYSFLKQYGSLYSGAPAFSFHAAIRDVIAPYIHQAIRGDLSASDALDRAAAKADQRLARLLKKGLLKVKQ